MFAMSGDLTRSLQHHSFVEKMMGRDGLQALGLFHKSVEGRDLRPLATG